MTVADSPFTENSAMGWPTWTTSPSATKCLTRTPSSGAGTTESTLSVAISMIGSSAETDWPYSTTHLMMVASARSPIWVEESPWMYCPEVEMRHKGTVDPGAVRTTDVNYPQRHQQFDFYPPEIKCRPEVQSFGLFRVRHAPAQLTENRPRQFQTLPPSPPCIQSMSCDRTGHPDVRRVICRPAAPRPDPTAE